MANNKNLENDGKATQFRSGMEAASNGQKGGIASGISRREKRHWRELLEVAFSMVVRNKEGAPSLHPVTGEPINAKEAAALKLVEKCAKGDIRAINTAADLLGEKSKTIKHEGLHQQNGDLVLAPKKKD